MKDPDPYDHDSRAPWLTEHPDDYGWLEQADDEYERQNEK